MVTLRLLVALLGLMLSPQVVAEEYVRDGPEVLVQDASVSEWWPEAPGTKLEIFIEDELQPNSSSLLTAGLQLHDQKQPFVTVHLASGGGRVLEALKIADELKKLEAAGRRVQTYVTEYSECYSACMIIFMAAKERFVSTTSRLGFHRARDVRNLTDKPTDAEERINDILYDMMVSAGVSKIVAAEIRNTPSDEIYIVEGFDAIEKGIATLETPTE